MHLELDLLNLDMSVGGFEIQSGIFNVGELENAKGGASNVPANEKEQWSLNTQIRIDHLEQVLLICQQTTGIQVITCIKS